MRRVPLSPFSSSLSLLPAATFFLAGHAVAQTGGVPYAPPPAPADTTVFATVNGQTITRDEYLHQLERQQVPVPGGRPTNAERVVLDQLVSNVVILAEAERLGVLPSAQAVEAMFAVQRRLFEQQFPGKSYDSAMLEQGTTPEEIKNDLRVQLAETNLYAKLIKLDEKEVAETFSRFPSVFGLPARVQLRLVMVPAKSPEFASIRKAFAAKKPFAQVAQIFNPVAMRGTGGLLPQTLPITQLPPNWQAKVSALPEGAVFGPVDFQTGASKAWGKIEKKLPEFTLSGTDALPLVRRQLVQLKLQDPNNQKIRDSILQKKLHASFSATDSVYDQVWNAVKENAIKAGVGSGAPVFSDPWPLSRP